ncbi:NAD(P)-dependent oxidoreductase [uncultured Bradyrhizobium sp.]|jgi:3-hydroxyisobutyrate dehydrogenase-like beta-hydroxyacid dehydrogenase|uniref:NAD(P)-dependent oxidoreductase n=1 Tax=uncultured Bradyrhizobium sp. TaxID=199684 RepID=UPI00262878B9|nr:NAD(P)-dependent oxidoreductase [uncultured Bradyrhizobium sp.]
MSAADTIGFVGLGVMGGPMCRNVAKKHAGRVLMLDRDAAAVAALSDTRAQAAASLETLAAACDVIFLSLPGGPQVEAVSGAIALAARPGTTIVDLSTTPVALARSVSGRLKARGVHFADAPVARTREAAQRGELSIMVGAEAQVFARIAPLLGYMGSDVTHCGEVGCGQVVKLINNALVFENTLALAEMMVVGERAGVKPETLLGAVSKGSGDSFVLRNHGTKAMLPRSFPDKAFPPEYVLKDLDYVLQLAADTGIRPGVAELARRYYDAARKQGLSGRYFPGVIEFIEKGGTPAEGQG